MSGFATQLAIVLALSLALPVASHAETLADAIALAYQTNPTLLSQRSQLQVTDETYVQAEAGFRPTASLQASSSYSKTPQTLFGSTSEDETNAGALTLSLTQPLYTGGRVTAQVHSAEAQIRAGREQLRGVENTVLFDVIQAYCDVLRDRASLIIQRDGLKALQDAADEIRARNEAGANTVIDVTQAQAQLELARAATTSAQAQLEVSTAQYVAVVGKSPGDLAPPPTLAALPKTLDDAFDVSEAENPTLRQAQYTEAAYRAQIQQARAAERPTVSVAGTAGYTGLMVPFESRHYDSAVTVSATVTQPLFTGGTTRSQIRQAVAQDTSARIQVDVARRNAIQTVAQAWSQRAAAHQNTLTNNAAVRAAQATFDGMRVEYRAGLRQTLDLLIAQETLTSAEINLADAQHDEYVAEAQLLGAVGRLETRIVLQGQPLYQPQVSFRRNEAKGSVPWDVIPKALDTIGAPGMPQPAPLPQPPSFTGPTRMTPADIEIDTPARKNSAKINW